MHRPLPVSLFFFFNDTATTEIYTLSLHDALPISASSSSSSRFARSRRISRAFESFTARNSRSEEHTSELQSQSNLVCRLLLEKKKKNNISNSHTLDNMSNAHTTVIQVTSCTHSIR